MNKPITSALTLLSSALLYSPSVALAQQGAVTQWHAHAQTLIASFAGRGNAAQAYTMALVQIAVYDATVAVRAADAKTRPLRPFIGGAVAPAGTDLKAAVATAAFRVGHERVNNNPAARAAYRNAYDAYLAAIPDGQAKTDGIAVGEAAAQAVLAARADDNFYNAAAFTNPAAEPGVWQSVAAATPYATAGANDHAMAFTRPLTASTPGALRIQPPPARTSDTYARDFDETKSYGALSSTVRTPAMTDVVQFWTESGFTLWSRNVRDIVTARGLDEIDSARVLAAFSVATGDAMLACFESKYRYMAWRPWQAIQRADDPDRTWTPTVRANHPEYPAGHGCYAGSATKALELLLGDAPVTLTSTGNQVAAWRVVPSARYQSLAQINADNANARVWGGLHWRTTMDRSSRWAAKIARHAVCGEFGLQCDKGRVDRDDD
jgi:hypothetical protein